MIGSIISFCVALVGIFVNWKINHRTTTKKWVVTVIWTAFALFVLYGGFHGR